MKKVQSIVGVSTLALLLSVGAQLAQAQVDTSAQGTTNLNTTSSTTDTSQTTNTTGSTTTTGTTDTTGTANTTGTTPGVPNTGAGGDMAVNLIVLASSAALAGLGTMYLSRRFSAVRR